MKFRKYAALFCAATLCTGFFGSCDDDIEGEEPIVDPSTTGFYVLNRGNHKANNASIAYYDLATGQMNGKFYENANSNGLGDSAEDILIYGSKTYVTVMQSNRLAILDKTGKLLKSIEPKNSKNEPMAPRYLAAANGKIYLTYFEGHSVAILDTATLEVEKVVSVGRYPEQLVVANNKLYVANSGGNDYPNYGKTVSVINLSAFTEEKKIEVMINPCRLEANSKGDVFVISMGDYSDEYPNTLQRIDAKTGEVTKMGLGGRMDLVNDKLYVLYAPYYTPEKTCIAKYDALTGKEETANLIPTINKVNTLSGIHVDKVSGNIYIMDAPYTETGSVSIYSEKGEVVNKSIDTKGYGPNSICFVGN